MNQAEKNAENRSGRHSPTHGILVFEYVFEHKLHLCLFLTAFRDEGTVA